MYLNLHQTFLNYGYSRLINIAQKVLKRVPFLLRHELQPIHQVDVQTQFLTFLRVAGQINKQQSIKYSQHVKRELQLHYMDQSESLYVKQVGHNDCEQSQYFHLHPERNQYRSVPINMLLQLVHIAGQFRQD